MLKMLNKKKAAKLFQGIAQENLSISYLMKKNGYSDEEIKKQHDRISAFLDKELNK